MRAFTSGQRRFPVVSRPLVWLLLVIACLTYPGIVWASDPPSRTVGSLSALALDSDFTANLAPKTNANAYLPAQITTVQIFASTIAGPETCKAPNLVVTANLSPSAILRTPSLPRPPPFL